MVHTAEYCTLEWEYDVHWYVCIGMYGVRSGEPLRNGTEFNCLRNMHGSEMENVTELQFFKKATIIRYFHLFNDVKCDKNCVNVYIIF